MNIISEFKDIPPFDDNIKPYYQINTDGIVRNKYTGKVIVAHKNDHGYWFVSLMTETGRVYRKVHRLVLMVFDFNPNYKILQGNHKNGNKNINSLWNLEWTTPKENKSHSILTGLSNGIIGSSNPKAILSENDVYDISNMILLGYSETDIIDKMPKVNRSMISNILSGKTWSHIFTNDQRDILYAKFYNTLSNKDRNNICLYYQNTSNDVVKFGSVTEKVKAALTFIGAELSDKNIRIAKRLYYRYDNPEITSNYNY